jgi:hypothetical protein
MMETTIRTKQYGREIILPNLTSEAGAKTYGPPCTLFLFLSDDIFIEMVVAGHRDILNG